MKNSASIILAGGRSTRMGSNKAFLPLPGKEHLTFIEQLVSTLTPLCAETILVARDAADAANYVLPGVHAVTDKVPDQGPLMGLYSGMSAIHTQRALVVAVDMPQGRHDPRSLLDEAPIQYIPEDELRSVDPDLRSFININTPEELHCP